MSLSLPHDRFLAWVSRCGLAAFLAVNTIATLEAAAPATPSLSSPADGATVIGTSVTLTWSSVGGAGAYSVGLRDLATNNLVNIPLVKGASTMQAIIQGHSYRWNVASCTTATGGDNTTNCPNRSGSRTFTVQALVPPSITLSPASQTVVAGTKVIFEAAAGGTPTPMVQWQVSTNGGTIFANISGATSTNYSLTAAASANGFRYRAGFTNSAGGPVYTNVAILTVNSPPVVTLNPSSQTVAAGAKATFTTAASGTPTPSVQWQVSLNGGVCFGNIDGATSTTYSPTAAVSQSGYLYRAAFTNSAGGPIYSIAANLRVNGSAQGWMMFPLIYANSDCSFPYTDGAYTSKSINTVLDHNLKINGNGFYQYGHQDDKDPTTGKLQPGADGIIVGFDNERASGGTLNGDLHGTCIKGAISLTTNSQRLTRPYICDPNDQYVAYDEHPGYDYFAQCNPDAAAKCKAGTGTLVRAVAAGTVVKICGTLANEHPCMSSDKDAPRRCINTNLPGGTCEDWGFVGIDHGNGYISQYGHLDITTISVSVGSAISPGQIIARSGNTCPPTPNSCTSPANQLGPHLHFEVLKAVSRILNGKVTISYEVVDPYGWTGPTGADPLYSKPDAPPTRLWQ